MKAAIFLNSGKNVTLPIEADIIICADGGYLTCPVKPNVIIGDFDSLSEIPDVKIIRHNPEKNYTDGETCVEYAKQKGATEIEFYGVLGGRYDHVLGNFANMAYADKLGIKAIAKEENLTIYFANGDFSFKTKKDCIVSVIPYGGDALVAHSENLYYPLENLLLKTDASRGISNVSQADLAMLNFASGSALVFVYEK